MKVIELFGGIGAPRKALQRLGIEHEVIDYVEIDKFAVKSYNAMYDTNYEPQDITEWDKDIEVDMIFHGSPCQDFSLAGKQAGGDLDAGTRSSLMWHTVRIVKKLKPKYVIWENVKNVISKNHKSTFDKYLKQMEELGYKNYYQVLNAKDYGIPQNRERVFCISILNNIEFNFPSKQELKIKLKDMLETNVDKKYYLSDNMKNYIVNTNEKWTGNNNGAIINKTIASTINTGEGSRRCDASNYVDKTLPENFNLQSIKIKNATKKGYKEAYDGVGVDLAYPDSTTRRGRVQEQKANTITTSDNLGVVEELKIRKLTPKECWRLMGFDDQDFEKASKLNSNTQLYKQAGNSIVVNVLEAIFKELFKKEKGDELCDIINDMEKER